jgi:hypothetical protein
MALIVLFVLIFPLFFDLESLSTVSTVSTDLSNFFSDFSILNHTAFWSRSCPALLTRFGPVNQALQADGKADFASTHQWYAPVLCTGGTLATTCSITHACRLSALLVLQPGHQRSSACHPVRRCQRHPVQMILISYFQYNTNGLIGQSCKEEVKRENGRGLTYSSSSVRLQRTARPFTSVSRPCQRRD